MFEVIGLALLLMMIVWITYRYYGTPESEYQKVLDRLMVNDFSHLETAEIKEHIDTTQQSIKELEADGTKSAKRKSHHLHHRMESVKLSLLTYELHKRECEKGRSLKKDDKPDV